MMEKKYICFGGEVFSSDGDIHKISCRKLPQLYKINPKDCIFIDNENMMIGRDPDWIESKIHLNPKSDGNYYDARKVTV